MSTLYMYVVDRDFGFAPNPFHSFCTLATCKPRIRNRAKVGDWVIGMGGSRLKATGRCIFAMRITEKVTFNEYWANPRFSAKKPVRNGSQKMMVGDNIYHRDANSNLWHQADSHHSLENGSVNQRNLRTDTISDKVLISEHFFYFGSEAPVVPQDLLNALEYKNSRGHRTFIDNPAADRLVKWLEISYRKQLNEVIGDPFDFDDSEKRYRGA